MKTIIIFLFGLLTGTVALAQQPKFVTGGTIEYNKTVNMFAIGRKWVNDRTSPIFLQAWEQYQKTQPQFVDFKCTLFFNKSKTLYTTVRPINVRTSGANPLANQFNNIFVDFATGKSTAQRPIQGSDFLVQDSIRKIKWRITGETRNIAGYQCREAHAVVQDSVYVVAFYTDKIWVSGGPESFSGLPGMILQVTLPREHVTWMATKVTVQDVPETVIVAPKKGQPVNNKQFVDVINKSFPGNYPVPFYQRKMFSL